MEEVNGGVKEKHEEKERQSQRRWSQSLAALRHLVPSRASHAHNIISTVHNIDFQYIDDKNQRSETDISS